MNLFTQSLADLKQKAIDFILGEINADPAKTVATLNTQFADFQMSDDKDCTYKYFFVKDMTLVVAAEDITGEFELSLKDICVIDIIEMADSLIK